MRTTVGMSVLFVMLVFSTASAFGQEAAKTAAPKPGQDDHR